MLHLQAILFPTDFMGHSEYAFHLACALAKDHGARLIVLHVLRPIVVYAEAGAVLQDAGFHEEAENQLHRFQPPASIRVEHRVVEGDPATEIVNLATDTACDLIVMETHGRSGLSRFFLGSVAEQVMRQAPCPVLTLKTPVAEKAPLEGELERDLVEA